MAKKMIIKGVGTMMAKRLTKDGGTEVITMGTLQNLKIDLAVEIEDIFGGDGLFAIDTLVKSKSINITATDAKFDLDAMTLMMGSTVEEAVEDTVWVLGEQQVVDGTGTATVEFATSVATDHQIAVRLKEENKVLKLITGVSEPTATEFKFDQATGKITTDVTNANKDIVINYRREETVDMVNILAEEVPFPVSVVHHGSFQQKDGTFRGLETELFACRAKGTFSIDAQRATASASQVALTVIDPERADGKLGTIKVYSENKRV